MIQDIMELVIWIDESLVAVNKPAGLATLPDGYNPSIPHLKSLLEPEFGRLWIVHRLDKDTSGIILLARTAQAHRSLNMQFEQRQVSKIYHALVAGEPEWQRQTVRLPLRTNGDRRHRTIVDPRAGKPAITDLNILERLPGCCLVEAVPHTGRTHQIRAHLAAVGLPILGDRLYSTRAAPDANAALEHSFESPGTQDNHSLALHALSITITHPLSGQPAAYTAPYPPDFSETLAQLHSRAS